MTTPTTPRWRAALTMRQMTDTLRETTLAGIQKVAPQSTLITIPAIAASYAALTAKGAKFATDASAASADHKVYLASAGTADASRLALDLELDTFKTLVENNSKSATDLTSTGLVLLTQTVASRTPPDPPAALLVKLGQVHGKARVAVAGKGYLGSFVAQVSADPTGPNTWEALPGNGKQRQLSGYATGTRLWVRFATVRFGMQSAWSVPALVIIP